MLYALAVPILRKSHGPGTPRGRPRTGARGPDAGLRRPPPLCWPAPSRTPATVRAGEDPMPSFTLTDVGRDLWVESFAVDAAGLGLSSPHPWSVTKRVLRGGRRDGVDLIQVNNG